MPPMEGDLQSLVCSAGGDGGRKSLARQDRMRTTQGAAIFGFQSKISRLRVMCSTLTPNCPATSIACARVIGRPSAHAITASVNGARSAGLSGARVRISACSAMSSSRVLACNAAL